MNWLDIHASGIQAFAALANLAVALVLALLTARYVRLTKTIARTSADQMAYLRDASSASKKQQASATAALATRLRDPIAGLPPDAPDHDRLFHYAQLNEDDIRTIETLARGIDSEAIALASKAAVPLHTIIAFIRQARSIALNYGWSPNAREKAR